MAVDGEARGGLFATKPIDALAIYVAYGRRHSLLRQGEVINPEADLEK